MTTPAEEWVDGTVRSARPLRDPTVRHEIRDGVIRLRRPPPLPARYVPPDCDLTYGDEEPPVPLPVAEAQREVNRALVAICSIGALIVVGIMLALGAV